VLVGFRHGATREAQDRALRGAGAQRQRAVGGVVVVRVPQGQVQSAVARLHGEATVRFAEPDWIGEVAATPNDPVFSKQWGLSNTGQTVNGITGTAGEDIDAREAWDVSTGSAAVVVGVVDTGVDEHHPDLVANLWSNPGGVNACAAGSHGYDALTNTCDPDDDDTVYGGHGTHVAGIIAAAGNNGTGIAGVAWKAKVLPVKTVGADGTGRTSDLLEGLDWLLRAKKAGVNLRVINDSQTFRGTAYSQALRDEIALLGSNGILFVSAGGNSAEDDDNPAVRRWPCGYVTSTSVCAAATTSSGALASYANRGATTVDLGAPGDNVYSTLRNGAYGYLSGSSMAAAHVSGVAALLLARQSLTATQLKQALLLHATRKPALAGLVRTGARLNACAALSGCSVTAAAAPRPFAVTPPVTTATGSGVPAPRAGWAVTTTAGVWSYSPTTYAYQWRRCSSSGTSCQAITGAKSSSYTPGSADVGHTLQTVVTATNSAGATTSASPPSLVVLAAKVAAFGVSSVGPSAGGFVVNRKVALATRVTAAGRFTRLNVYLQRTRFTGYQDLVGVVYKDSNGRPGALVAKTWRIRFSSTQAAGWRQIGFWNPVPVTPGRYWIGVIAGSSNGVAGYRWRSSTGGRAQNYDPFSNGPSNPFGTATTDATLLSLYATWNG
jgi:subtilisin family serine protease